MPQDALLPQCAFGIKELQRWDRTVSQRPPGAFSDALPRQDVDGRLGNGRIEHREVDRSRRSIQGLQRPRQFLALDLDDREAAALSPIHWPVPNGSTPGGTVLDCLVGADESPEFLRQSRMMTDHWAAHGVETRYEAKARREGRSSAYLTFHKR